MSTCLRLGEIYFYSGSNSNNGDYAYSIKRDYSVLGKRYIVCLFDYNLIKEVELYSGSLKQCREYCINKFERR